MNKSTFELSRQVWYFLIVFPFLLLAKLAELMVWRDLGWSHPLQWILLTVCVLTVVYPFVARGYRLTITDDYIEVINPFWARLSFRWTWREITDIAIVRMGRSLQVYFLRGSERKQLNPMMWTLLKSTLPIEEPVQGFFSSNLRLEDQAVCQVIRHHAPEIKEQSGAEAARFEPMLQDIGALAGLVAGASVALALLALFCTVSLEAKPLDNELIWWYVGSIAVIAYSVILMVKAGKSNSVVTHTLAALFAACLSWATVMSGHLYAQTEGERTREVYVLVNVSDAAQHWRAENRELPDINIHAKPGNFVLLEKGARKEFTILNGPFGIRDVPRYDIEQAFKKRQFRQS
jgi:hypothetical protein